MAPYSSNSFDHADIDPFVDAPPLDSPALKQQQQQLQGYDTPTTTDTTTVEGEEENTASVFDNFLDCSLCFNSGTSSFPTAMNPSPSAVFKARSCAECGGKCTKLQGYKKEEVLKTIALEVDPDTGEEKEIKVSTKMYYHKWCHQVKEYRDEHQHRDDGDDYESVMRNLLDYFRALELEAQLKKEAELRRKEQAEEALRMTLAQELEQAAKDDAAKAEKQKKKPRKLLKNVKKSFSMKKKDKSDDAAKAEKQKKKPRKLLKNVKKSFSLKKKDKSDKATKSDNDDSSVTSSVASVKKSFSLKKKDKKKKKSDKDDLFTSSSSAPKTKKSFSLKKKDKKKDKSDKDDLSITSSSSGSSKKKSFSLKKKKAKAEKENSSSAPSKTATTTKDSKPTKAKPLSARQAALAN
eukprot:CAMPEP_0170848048 /NCGR_PEP_ID=MMETSP0734-20130129/9134_1 /TAXON_ID=186038 /ORGANISM="Fragilariopsis kerguelensis, Strain L26-C5" /LENGTH=406 /DNA_ID=CAMNT_0011217359 /DNA_START=74 /DNA_END=1291 /DNA_ORIENTATION=+